MHVVENLCGHFGISVELIQLNTMPKILSTAFFKKSENIF